jgi:hypothetical protein
MDHAEERGKWLNWHHILGPCFSFQELIDRMLDKRTGQEQGLVYCLLILTCHLNNNMR